MFRSQTTYKWTFWWSKLTMKCLSIYIEISEGTSNLGDERGTGVKV